MGFSNYKFHCHMVGKIVTVPKPLTPSQKETLTAFTCRFNGEGKPLSVTQKRNFDFTTI